MSHYLLSIDQGTTSTRAIVFSSEGKNCGQYQVELKQYYPHSGWVEHDGEEIWQAVIICCQQAVKAAGLTPEQIAGIGITNQRETTLIWDRKTGKPIYRAIVWQDRRTADWCDELKQAGHEATIQQKTGLLLDPYFSASKIRWILDQVPGARVSAEQGELAFGTIDTFLLWRLTGGRNHKTDATNASRTSLFNIHQQVWDAELLDLFAIPVSLLPEVMDCCADFGTTDNELLWEAKIPIAGIAGDQQAALIGQACFQPGMAKSTYGTGCFLVLNTGNVAIKSHQSLLTTIAYRIDGVTTYALEGSIFVAGAAVQWLRDGLKIIHSAAETQALAESINSDQAVYLIPAFTGLGAPHWDPDARGALLGLTRDTGPAEIATAALQSVCYQTADLVKAMEQEGAARSTTLRVDGGMVANDWLVQFLADILDAQVDRPVITETTALGAAYLAGLQLGIYQSLDHVAQQWQGEKHFIPSMSSAVRERLYHGWQTALNRIKTR